MAKTSEKLVVIGGGAAGFFCAVNAARLCPGLEVIILEKSNKVLSKVKVSGGGRCNVTHHCFSIADMIRKYPRGTNFLKKAFHQFFTTDTIAWFQQRGVALQAEADGRMFPVTNNSQTVIDCLVAEANKYGVELRMHSDVRSVECRAMGEGSSEQESHSPETSDGKQQLKEKTGKPFIITLADGRTLEANFVCVACGGYPKSAMFEWIRALGHTVEEPVPSLFTFNMPGNPVTALMGVSVPDVQVRIAGSKLMERGPLLITHWGMSGPVVLRLSAWGARELAGNQYTFTLLVNWLPEWTEQSLRELFQSLRFDLASAQMGNKNPFQLPNRLWEYLLQQSGIAPATRWADLPAKEQNRLIKNCCAQEHAVQGKTTFKEEFVTAGGVRLTEVEAHTMQSKILPNLFFAGEILDVDGITGGFNFQHAWTSGSIAATAIAKRAAGD